MSKSATIGKVRGAVIVTRVSTGEQAKHGTSLEGQLEACRLKALALDLPIIGEYEDAGISGGMYLMRGGMQSALADIMAGRASTLVCANMSRYSRDVEHQQRIRREVRAAGGNVVFCDMTFDDTPEGDLAFNIMGGFAEYERKVIRKRTMEGRYRRAAEGIQIARKWAPYGYHIVTKEDILFDRYPAHMAGKYVIVEEQAAIVREMFSAYAEGALALPGLARDLNTRGIPTSRGAIKWYPSSVMCILTNTAYIGTATYGAREYRTDESRLQTISQATGNHYTSPQYSVPAAPGRVVTIETPAIIDMDTWNGVRDRMAQNRSARGGNPNTATMLSGRVFCPNCGGPMHRNTDSKKRGGLRYFQCGRRKFERITTGTKVCQGGSYAVPAVESHVVRTLEAAIDNPKALTVAMRAYAEANNTPKASTQSAAAIRQALANLDQEESATVKAQIAGIRAGASAGVYAAVFGELAERRNDLQSQLAKAQPRTTARQTPTTRRNPKGDDGQQFLQDVHTALTSSDVSDSEKRRILGILVDHVVCQKGGSDIYVYPDVICDIEMRGTLHSS